MCPEMIAIRRRGEGVRVGYAVDFEVPAERIISSNKLFENRLAGVHIVNSVASTKAIPANVCTACQIENRAGRRGEGGISLSTGSFMISSLIVCTIVPKEI